MPPAAEALAALRRLRRLPVSCVSTRKGCSQTTRLCRHVHRPVTCIIYVVCRQSDVLTGGRRVSSKDALGFGGGGGSRGCTDCSATGAAAMSPPAAAAGAAVAAAAAGWLPGTAPGMLALGCATAAEGVTAAAAVSCAAAAAGAASG